MAQALEIPGGLVWLEGEMNIEVGLDLDRP